MIDLLPLGLHWDRDYLIAIADTIRPVSGALSLLVVNPFTMYVMGRHTKMSNDCRVAYMVHHMTLLGFDVYNCFFYRMYTLSPLPYFMCTGLLCTENVSSRLLFTILAFWTVALCVPYLFVMMRMHQRMLHAKSRLRIGLAWQGAIFTLFCVILLLNVIGFAVWSTEHDEKERILNEPTISWAKNVSKNFLVLGEHPGEVRDFLKELALLAVSIAILFSYYIFITWHAGWKIGKNMAYLSAVMFVAPLLVLFLSLTTNFSVINGEVLAATRFGALMLFSHCSFGHAFIFLSKNPWFRKTFLKANKANATRSVAGQQTSNVASPTSIVI